MGRPKKEKPNHGKYFEVKKTVGHKLNGDPVRKSFYSPTSKDDAREQAKKWMVEKEVSERTGEAFIEKDIAFAEWAKSRPPDCSGGHRNAYSVLPPFILKKFKIFVYAY